MLRIPSVMIITGLRLGEHMRTQQDRSEGREREREWSPTETQSRWTLGKVLIGYTYCISYLILHLPFYHDACYKNKATAGLATPGKSHLFLSGSEDKSWYLQHFVSGVKVSVWNSHGRREAAHPFFYLDCVFPCILKVICKNIISNIFFRQLAKLSPELAPTVVSEHETFDSVEQVLGHTSILWISCSKCKCKRRSHSVAWNVGASAREDLIA